MSGGSKVAEKSTCSDRNYWVTPVPLAPITSPFGWAAGRNYPHAGLDLGHPEGTKIRCGLNGHVTRVPNNGACGNSLSVDNGHIKFRYCHLSSYKTSVDGPENTASTVKADDICGLVGTTGRSSGPHLHWEVYVAGELIDPMQFKTLYAENTVAEGSKDSESTACTSSGVAALDPLEIRWERVNGKYVLHALSYRSPLPEGQNEDEYRRRHSVDVVRFYAFEPQAIPAGESGEGGSGERVTQSDANFGIEPENSVTSIQKPLPTDSAEALAARGDKYIELRKCNDNESPSESNGCSKNASAEYISAPLDLPLGEWIKLEARGFSRGGVTRGPAEDIPVARGVAYLAVGINASTTMYVRQVLPSDPSSAASKPRSTYALGLERAVTQYVGGILAYADGCGGGDAGCRLNNAGNFGFWRDNDGDQQSSGQGTGLIGITYPFQEGGQTRKFSIRVLNPSELNADGTALSTPGASLDFSAAVPSNRFEKTLELW